MSELFLTMCNMSISAGWLVIAVVLVRQLLKKAPKTISLFLWALVAWRLICPIAPESILSLLPSGETIPQEIIYMETPAVHSGVSALNATINPYLAQTMTPQVGDSVNPMQIAVLVAVIVWLCGAAGMLLYALFSYIRISLRVREAVCLQDNVYVCDRVTTPFILGILRPRVYLPSCMRTEDKAYVLAHETAHLSRRDHIIKPLGFLLLSVYWFHPLIWVAYLLFCRDIELACDERVIRTHGADIKKPYAQALITASAPRTAVSVCPLAFGETGVRGRIKAILQYKKPAFWLIVVSVVACVALVVTFLTNPKQPALRADKNDMTVMAAASAYDGVVYEYVSGSVQDKKIRARWTNNTDKVLCFGTPYTLDQYRTTCEPNTPIGFDDLLHTVAPGKSFTETYDLSAYDLSTGTYRLGKTFFLQDAPNNTYTAYVQFMINEMYTFQGVQYEAETIVYDDERYAFTLSIDETPPQFYVSDNYLSLVTNVSGNYQVTNMMGRHTLTKENFDDILTFGWKDGFSAQTLREQNRLALEVQDSNTGHFILLEQQNGDLYIGAGINGIRWIFKVREVEQETGLLPRGELPLINGNVFINDAALVRAREKYPQFFDLDTSAGLIVNVWQMAAGSCRCYLDSAALDAVSDNSFAYDVGVSIPEMCAILSTYDLPADKISIRAVQNPLSSYAYTIDEQYKAQLHLLFRRVGVLPAPKTEELIAQADVDIDRDGKTEYCTLRVGPTSGMYTFYLTVDDMMYLYYSRTFVKGFDTNAKGQTVIVQENGNNGKTQEIVMVMQDGKVDLVGGSDLVLSGKTAIIAPETLFNHNHP
ncbi:MAG: hypothetical protein J6L00_02775 [Clostridia bacterium]|nr:hypothetical protein [Clostridia bacterium]